MAETVGFNIGINTKDAVSNVEKLEGSLGKLDKNGSQSINELVQNMANVSIIMDNMTVAAERLMSSMDECVSIYKDNAEASAKLEHIMRLTTGATQEEIDAIHQLVIEQEKLGVVAGGTQEAALQELATYVESSESLKTLLPVMNDMIVQQIGLGASGEQAAAIATMLGKVMQGQTTALSRVGFAFDEAQEKVLKFGTEEERAAMLADVVSQSVGGINLAMPSTDVGKMQQLQNHLDNIKSAIGEVALKVQPALSGIIKVGQTAGSIMILKNAVVAAKVAFDALSKSAKIALASTGIGLAVAGAMMLYEYLYSDKEAIDDINESSNAFADTQKMINDSVAQQKVALDSDISALKELIESQGDEVKMVSQMNDKYGELFGTYKSAQEWYDKLSEGSVRLMKIQLLQAQSDELVKQMAQNEIKRMELASKKEDYAKHGWYSKIGAVDYDIRQVDAENKALKSRMDQINESIRAEKQALKDQATGADIATDSYKALSEKIDATEKALKELSSTDIANINLYRGKLEKLKAEREELGKKLGLIKETTEAEKDLFTIEERRYRFSAEAQYDRALAEARDRRTVAIRELDKRYGGNRTSKSYGYELADIEAKYENDLKAAQDALGSFLQTVDDEMDKLTMSVGDMAIKQVTDKWDNMMKRLKETISEDNPLYEEYKERIENAKAIDVENSNLAEKVKNLKREAEERKTIVELQDNGNNSAEVQMKLIDEEIRLRMELINVIMQQENISSEEIEQMSKYRMEIEKLQFQRSGIYKNNLNQELQQRSEIFGTISSSLDSMADTIEDRLGDNVFSKLSRSLAKVGEAFRAMNEAGMFSKKNQLSDIQIDGQGGNASNANGGNKAGGMAQGIMMAAQYTLEKLSDVVAKQKEIKESAEERKILLYAAFALVYDDEIRKR